MIFFSSGLKNYFIKILVLAQYLSLEAFSKASYQKSVIFPGGFFLLFGSVLAFLSSSPLHPQAYVKNLLTHRCLALVARICWEALGSHSYNIGSGYLISIQSLPPFSSTCRGKTFLVLEHQPGSYTHGADDCHIFNYTRQRGICEIELANCGEGRFIMSLHLLFYFLYVYFKLCSDIDLQINWVLHFSMVVT